MLAKSYYNTSLLLVLSFGVFLFIFYFAFENWLFGLLTSDPDVIAIMQGTMVLFAIFSVIDQLQ